MSSAEYNRRVKKIRDDCEEQKSLDNRDAVLKQRVKKRNEEMVRNINHRLHIEFNGLNSRSNSRQYNFFNKPPVMMRSAFTAQALDADEEVDADEYERETRAPSRALSVTSDPPEDLSNPLTEVETEKALATDLDLEEYMDDVFEGVAKEEDTRQSTNARQRQLTALRNAENLRRYPNVAGVGARERKRKADTFVERASGQLTGKKRLVRPAQVREVPKRGEETPQGIEDFPMSVADTPAVTQPSSGMATPALRARPPPGYHYMRDGSLMADRDHRGHQRSRDRDASPEIEMEDDRYRDREENVY